MLKRFIPLVALVALAAPVAASATPGGHLDSRFDRFAHRCLVAGAPPQCAHAAARILARLDRAEARIDHLEARIHEKCSQANPPKRCAHAADAVAKLDALKAKLEGFESQIRAKYPG
jgi:hypothetical protein